MKLLPCPFCGSYPKIIERGNDRTYRRFITIKCPICRAERTDGAIKHDMEWVRETAIENWNKRHKEA